MLDESWQLKKTLTEGISNEVIESAYTAAMGAVLVAASCLVREAVGS